MYPEHQCHLAVDIIQCPQVHVLNHQYRLTEKKQVEINQRSFLKKDFALHSLHQVMKLTKVQWSKYFLKCIGLE